MKYALKMKSSKNNPTYLSLFDIDEHKEMFIDVRENATRNNLPLESSSLYIDKLFQDAEINTDCIKPMKIPNFPAYIAEPVDVCFSLLNYPKKENNEKNYNLNLTRSFHCTMAIIEYILMDPRKMRLLLMVYPAMQNQITLPEYATAPASLLLSSKA